MAQQEVPVPHNFKSIKLPKVPSKALAPGSHSLSDSIDNLIRKVAFETDIRYGTKNGETALYWHLISIVEQHKDKK